MASRKYIILSLLFILGFLPPLFSIDKSELILASWNIRILSNNSRDSEELQYITDIISRYDLVAVQEVRDEEVLKRIMKMLPANWDYIISDKAGRGVKERYAYLYDTDLVQNIGIAYLLDDPEDAFIREPFIANFISGKFDFTLITFHALFGDSINDRRKEIRLLPEVMDLVDSATGNEKDIILLGDFNMPENDASWSMSPYTSIIPFKSKTTITDTSSYDNFWIHQDHTYDEEYISLYEIYHFDEELFDNNDKLASSTCSDHRPISILLNNSFDSDISENWYTAAHPIKNPYVTAIAPSVESYSYYKLGDLKITDVITKPTDKEAISIKNISGGTISLDGWTLGDKNNPNSYTFPYGTIISPNETIIIHHSALNFVINNTNEILYIMRPDEVIIETWTAN